MILPNVIIAGAPKSGTSSLHFWLEAHPETHGSKRKDSCYLEDHISRFNENLNYLEHGLEGYQKLFSHTAAEKSKIVFESTATYMGCPGTPKIIASLPSNPKIIFILRNPKERLSSQYLFEKYRTKSAKNLRLEDYLTNNSIIESSRYGELLERWQEHISKDRFIVLIFEELIKSPVTEMKSLCVQLGIDPSFYDNYAFQQRNKTVKIKNSRIHRLGLKLQPLFPSFLQEKIVPLYIRLNSNKKPDLLPQEKRILDTVDREEFQKERENVEKFLGRKIDVWS